MTERARKKREKELKMQKEMSEKSYNQHLIKKFSDVLSLVSFVFKFLFIGMTIAVAVFAGLYYILGNTYNLVCLIIFSVILLATIIAYVIWKVFFEKEFKTNLKKAQEVVNGYLEQERQSNLKKAQMLKRQEK